MGIFCHKFLSLPCNFLKLRALSQHRTSSTFIWYTTWRSRLSRLSTRRCWCKGVRPHGRCNARIGVIPWVAPPLPYKKKPKIAIPKSSKNLVACNILCKFACRCVVWRQIWNFYTLQLRRKRFQDVSSRVIRQLLPKQKLSTSSKLQSFKI